MTRWDAARGRQQQTPRRYRACGPVGPQTYQALMRNIPVGTPARSDWNACQGCGHHVCSCPPKRIPEPLLGNPLSPRERALVMELLEAGAVAPEPADPLDEAFRKELAKRGGVQEGP